MSVIVLLEKNSKMATTQVLIISELYMPITGVFVKKIIKCGNGFSQEHMRYFGIKVFFRALDKRVYLMIIFLISH